MIQGTVLSNLDLIVSLTVFGNDGKSLEIQAQIDTGFDGSLTLPPESIEILNLSLAGEARISLADGSIVQQEVYSGTVLWDETGR